MTSEGMDPWASCKSTAMVGGGSINCVEDLFTLPLRGKVARSKERGNVAALEEEDDADASGFLEGCGDDGVFVPMPQWQTGRKQVAVQ